MGIHDRDYMRDEPGGGWSPNLRIGDTPGIVLLFIVANVAVFILQTAFRDTWGFTHPEPSAPIPGLEQLPAEARAIVEAASRDAISVRTGGLSIDALKSGQFHTLITHQFVAVSVFHLAFCVVALFFAGRVVAKQMGVLAFVVAYLIGGLAGGLPILALQWQNPELGPQLGATASVSAVFGFFAMAMPEKRINVLLFFVVPVRGGLLRGAYIWAAVNAGLFLLGYAFPVIGVGWLGNAAGTLCGLGLGRMFAASGETAKAGKSGSKTVPYRKRTENPKIIEAEFTDKKPDYNEILDKINREGIGSLTEQEKRILEQASENLRGK